MSICFQMNPEGCPNIRHPGQRLIDVQAAWEHPALMKFTVEPICEDPVLFAHRMQAVSSDKKIARPQIKLSSLSALNEAAERLSRQTVDRCEGVMAAIAFIQQHIRYDAGLARDYDQGLCEGLSLEEAWTLGQGTCREIAMVMGALCQAQGIPVRFVQGISAPDRLHCWNEVYFDGAGWLPVDAQAGMIGQWGNLIALRVVEKAEDLPLPYNVKLMITEPLAVQQDCQVYLKLKKIPEGITEAGQVLIKSWSSEGNVRCLIHLAASVENQELRKAMEDLKLRLNACFIADSSNFIDLSDLSSLPRLEAIGCQLELSGFTMRLAAGFDRLSGRLMCWLEILVSDMEWVKLDLNAKSLGYKSEWVRLVHASTAASLLNMLEKTIGS